MKHISILIGYLPLPFRFYVIIIFPIIAFFIILVKCALVCYYVSDKDSATVLLVAS